MQGFLLTFFTQSNRCCEEKPVSEWLIDQAREIGARGATVFSGMEGFGHDGHLHSEGYFNLDDNPRQIVMALTPEESEQLFSRIKKAKLQIFYTKAHIEFGLTD